MIGQRPTDEGGEERFVAMHFVAGGACDTGTIAGHLLEGTRVKGCMQVFVTELLAIEVLKPVDVFGEAYTCLLYTSPSPRDRTRSRMTSSA